MIYCQCRRHSPLNSLSMPSDMCMPIFIDRNYTTTDSLKISIIALVRLKMIITLKKSNMRLELTRRTKTNSK